MESKEEMSSQELRESLFSVVDNFHKINMKSIIHDISQKEFMTLEMIGRYVDKYTEEKGICVTKLAKFQKVSSPSVSRALRSLEEKGLIVRSMDTQDRRNVYVKLTEKGKKRRKEIVTMMDHFFESVMDRMGHEKAKQWIDLCFDFEDAMQQQVIIVKSENNENDRRSQ